VPPRNVCSGHMIMITLIKTRSYRHLVRCCVLMCRPTPSIPASRIRPVRPSNCNCSYAALATGQLEKQSRLSICSQRDIVSLASDGFIMHIDMRLWRAQGSGSHFLGASKPLSLSISLVVQWPPYGRQVLTDNYTLYLHAFIKYKHFTLKWFIDCF